MNWKSETFKQKLDFMQEDKLMKYDNRQLKKVDNLIALTNKILASEDQEEIKILSEGGNHEEPDNRILAIQMIKAQVIKARAGKEEKLAQESKESKQIK